MASNGWLMTVPDFPNRLRELEGARRPDGRLRPAPHRDRQGRRRAPLRPARHRRRRAAGDAARAVRRGADRRRRRTSTGSTRSRRRSPTFTPERAERGQRRAGRRDPADRPRVRRGRRGGGYGRIGVSTQGFGAVCQWAIQLLNIVTGNLDRAGGTLFTDPAIDVVGARPDRPRALRRAGAAGCAALPEFGGELPVSVLREEIETPGEGQIRAMLTIAGNPVLSTPDGARARPGARRAGLHGGRRHLHQRDHPARRRDPAADHRARARPLRPGLPRCSRSATPRGSPRRCSPKPTDARHDWEIFREIALRTGDARLRQQDAAAASALTARARLSRQPDRDHRRRCCAPAGPASTMRQLRKQPGRRRPRAAAARPLPGRLQTKDKRIDAAPGAGARRPRPAARPASCRGDGELVLIGRRHQRDNNSWMHNTERLTRASRGTSC